ncbi:MAG: serine hydrolase [Lacunisphaera sp.]|nr:serine hydrolase [Lacunisphaera sp.]
MTTTPAPRFVRNFIRRLLALGAATILPLAQAAPPPNVDTALKAWLGTQPGGAAVAWVDAEGVTFFNAGSFGAGDARAVTPDTIFEIGSVTKVFTSLLLAESERAGRVSRDDPAAKYLLPPGADPAALTKITLVSLATHTSGLPRLPGNMKEASGPHPYENYGQHELLAAFAMHGPTAPADGATVYSNFGAALLGQTLAAAWGQSYPVALTAHVLEPLGLAHTTLNMTGSADPANLIPGHTGPAAVDHWKFQSMAPGGALLSSARDLSLFVQAGLGLRATPLAASLAEMMKPLRKMDSPPGQIGLGWLIMDNAGTPLVWHNGGTAGFRSFIGLLPSAKAGVVVLVSNSALNPDALGQQLLGVKPPVAPAAAPVADAAVLTGSYSFTPDLSIVITERKGTLGLQMTAQPRLALKEKPDGRFAVVDVPAEVSFERDAAGQAIALILHQNGLDQRAPRTVELALPPGKLADYVGTFALATGITMTMTVDDGRLFTQLTGQSKLRAFASAPDQFFLKVVNAQLRFERGGDGKITAVVLRQNGRDQRAAKVD